MNAHIRIDGRLAELWAETSVGKWLVRARLGAQNGRLIVEELRIEPRGVVPRGGITQHIIRGVPLGLFGPYAQAVAVQSPPSLINELPVETIAALVKHGSEDRPRPRRPTGKDDRFYARLAEAYIGAIRRGSRSPVKTLAKARKVPDARVRDMLHEARVRGLLSKGEPGRIGGVLSQRAQRILGEKP